MVCASDADCESPQVCSALFGSANQFCHEPTLPAGITKVVSGVVLHGMTEQHLKQASVRAAVRDSLRQQLNAVSVLLLGIATDGQGVGLGQGRRLQEDTSAKLSFSATWESTDTAERDPLTKLQGTGRKSFLAAVNMELATTQPEVSISGVDNAAAAIVHEQVADQPVTLDASTQAVPPTPSATPSATPSPSATATTMPSATATATPAAAGASISPSPSAGHSCTNGRKDVGETDVDCGGVCGSTCSSGFACDTADSCAATSLACVLTGSTNTCQASERARGSEVALSFTMLGAAAVDLAEADIIAALSSAITTNTDANNVILTGVSESRSASYELMTAVNASVMFPPADAAVTPTADEAAGRLDELLTFTSGGGLDDDFSDLIEPGRLMNNLLSAILSELDAADSAVATAFAVRLGAIEMNSVSSAAIVADVDICIAEPDRCSVGAGPEPDDQPWGKENAGVVIAMVVLAVFVVVGIYVCASSARRRREAGKAKQAPELQSDPAPAQQNGSDFDDVLRGAASRRAFAPTGYS